MKKGEMRYFCRIALGIHMSGTDYVKIGYQLKKYPKHAFLNKIYKERKRQIGVNCTLKIGQLKIWTT